MDLSPIIQKLKNCELQFDPSIPMERGVKATIAGMRKTLEDIQGASQAPIAPGQVPGPGGGVMPRSPKGPAGGFTSKK